MLIRLSIVLEVTSCKSKYGLDIVLFHYQILNCRCPLW